MSSSNEPSIALRVCFGTFGVISVIVTVVSFHYREAIGCELCRRLTKCRVACKRRDYNLFYRQDLTIGKAGDVETGVLNSEAPLDNLTTTTQSDLGALPLPCHELSTTRSRSNASVPGFHSNRSTTQKFAPSIPIRAQLVRVKMKETTLLTQLHAENDLEISNSRDESELRSKDPAHACLPKSYS